MYETRENTSTSRRSGKREDGRRKGDDFSHAQVERVADVAERAETGFFPKMKRRFHAFSEDFPSENVGGPGSSPVHST